MCTDLHWHVSMKVHFIFVRAYAYTAYTAYTVYAYIRRWSNLHMLNATGRSALQDEATSGIQDFEKTINRPSRDTAD